MAFIWNLKLAGRNRPWRCNDRPSERTSAYLSVVPDLRKERSKLLLSDAEPFRHFWNCPPVPNLDSCLYRLVCHNVFASTRHEKHECVSGGVLYSASGFFFKNQHIAGFPGSLAWPRISRVLLDDFRAKQYCYRQQWKCKVKTRAVTKILNGMVRSCYAIEIISAAKNLS